MDQQNIRRTTLSIPQKSMGNFNKLDICRERESANEVKRKNPNSIRDYSPFNEFLTSHHPIEVTLGSGLQHVGHLMRLLPNGWIELAKTSAESNGMKEDQVKLVFKSRDVTHIQELKRGESK